MNEEDTIKAMVYWRAVNEGLPARKLMNLIESESNWDVNAVGDGGCSYGLIQINTCVHNGENDTLKITPAMATSTKFALDFLFEHALRNDYAPWSSCSCVKMTRTRVPDLPKGDAEDFKPNTTLYNAEAVLLKYGSVRHIAAIKEIRRTGIYVFEGNKEPCKIGYRLIPWSELEYTLVGYYKT